MAFGEMDELRVVEERLLREREEVRCCYPYHKCEAVARCTRFCFPCLVAHPALSSMLPHYFAV